MELLFDLKINPFFIFQRLKRFDLEHLKRAFLFFASFLICARE